MSFQGSESTSSIAVIILAAGGSSRLGQPKQLLQYRGRSLLQHAIDEAWKIHPVSVIVVLGAQNETISATIGTGQAEIMVNTDWQAGIASSIRCGISRLSDRAEIDGALLMVCDQPFVTGEILKKITSVGAAAGKSIVACEYDGTMGTPVLFHKRFFPELMKLTGDSGAKKLLKKYPGETASLSFEPGRIDIDTVGDYQKLNK